MNALEADGLSMTDPSVASPFEKIVDIGAIAGAVLRPNGSSRKTACSARPSSA